MNPLNSTDLANLGGTPALWVKHIFVATNTPTPHDLHCWFAHQTNKCEIDSRINCNGRIVELVCAENAVVPHTIDLQLNTFTFRRTEPVKLFKAKTGDMASISVALCHTIKLRETNKIQVVIDAFGRVKPEYKSAFMAYLEKTTGLTGLVGGACDVGITPHALVEPENRGRKVWMVGSMNLTLRAKVGDASLFNRLAAVAIGKRRSYGFGSVKCLSIETSVEVEEAQAEEMA